jgi:hypothetical protein
MKRIIISIFALSMFFNTNAQVEKGAIALMGGIHVLNDMQREELGSLGTTYSRFNRTNVDFGGMYFLGTQFALGAALLVNNSASLSGTDQNDLKLSSSRALTGGRIFGRYYHPCFAPRFYTFGQVDLSFAGGANKSYDGDGNEEFVDNVSQVGAGIRTGISYFLFPAIALEMNFGLFGWQQTTPTNSDAEDIKSVNNTFEFLALSKTITLGFCWYLGRSGGFAN